jgi:excisionase family DNA binding protein
MNKKNVLKLADVERELGVSRWTLYEWLKTGKLYGFKLPCGHYRIPVDEVTRLTTKVKIEKVRDN